MTKDAALLQGPGASNTPRIQRKDTQEREEKARHFGAPTLLESLLICPAMCLSLVISSTSVYFSCFSFSKVFTLVFLQIADSLFDTMIATPRSLISSLTTLNNSLTAALHTLSLSLRFL